MGKTVEAAPAPAAPAKARKPARPAKAKVRTIGKERAPVTYAQLNAIYGGGFDQDPVKSIEAQVAREAEIARAAEVVRLARDCFDSKDPKQHIAGARLLGGITDERLALIQHEWFDIVGEPLYAYLFKRSAQGVTPGIAHALTLLRQAYVRNEPIRRAFKAVYTDENIIGAYAWQVGEDFTPTVTAEDDVIVSVRETYGLAALRDHPRSVLGQIDIAFRKAHGGVDIVNWIIANVPRTEASLKAIAIMRDGDDRSHHVDLAVTLIPPSHSNKTHVLAMLKGVGFAERRRLEQAFNHTFTGVAPTMGEREPDTLRGHLAKLDPAVLDPRVYQECVMLLNHEPTRAEQLYLLLSSWWNTENEPAIAFLQDCVNTGVTRAELERDWRRYVALPQPGVAKAFTDRSLTEQIDHVYYAWPTATRRRIKRLLDTLEARAEPAAAAAQGDSALERQLSDRARDNAAHRSEERRLIAAYGELKENEPRIGADDKAILSALGVIYRVYQERIARLSALAEAASKDPRLSAAERRAAARFYADEAQKAVREDREARSALDVLVRERQYLVVEALQARSISLPSASLKLSVSRREDARLMIAHGPNVADQVWIARRDGEDGDLVAVITKAWASGGMDALHAEAARPVLDTEGRVIRPGFDIIKLLSSMTGSLVREYVLLQGEVPRLPTRRALALAEKGASDAERGAARIAVEMVEGSSDTDLGPIADLFAQPALKPALRDGVIKAFVDAHLPKDGPGSGAPPAERFLTHMARTHEGLKPNFVRLKGLIAPPTTAVERVEHMNEIRQAGEGGALAGVSKGVARVISEIDGDFLGEAEERSRERADFFARATDDQLASIMAMAGVKTREELAAKEAAMFDARHGELHALEATCATLIAGFVETLVEAGLSPFTGGAGLAAIIGAGVAAAAGMLASEAMLGAEFKLICFENLNKVISDSVGTALVEWDLRKRVLQYLPMKALGETARQTGQNIVTGWGETLINTGVGLGLNLLDRDRWPSDDEIAKFGDSFISMALAKTASTQITLRYHPGLYHAYMPFAERLKTQILFKLSLKAQSVGNEVVSVLVTNARDQTLADQALQVLWKAARSSVTATVKGAASGLGGAGTAQGEKLLIERFRAKQPRLFAAVMREVLEDHYERSADLKAEHAAARGAGAEPSAADKRRFMVHTLSQPEAPGETKIARLASAIHKDVASIASAMLEEDGAPGVLTYRTPAPSMRALATEVEDPVRIRAERAQARAASRNASGGAPTEAGSVHQVLERLKTRPGLGLTPDEAAVVHGAPGLIRSGKPGGAPVPPPAGFASAEAFRDALRQASAAGPEGPRSLAARGIRLDLATASKWRARLLDDHREAMGTAGEREARALYELMNAEVVRLSAPAVPATAP